MEKIDRLKQLLLTHRIEDITKLTFEERLDFDDAFAQEIVKLFAIPAVSQRSEQLIDFLTWYIHKSDMAEGTFSIQLIVDQYLKSINCG